MATPTAQLLSRTLYATDGLTTVWDFAFSGGYLDPSHVKAFTETPAGVRTPIVITEPMLIGEFQLQITPALAAGDELTIYRDTPKDLPLVDFTDEAGFSEISLDTNAKQAVFIAAEAIDTVNSLNVAAAIEAEESAGDSALAAAASASSSAASALAASIHADSANDAKASAAISAASATSAAGLAQSAYDSFDDRWLGPKESDPALDNDGASLLIGTVYFNTTANQHRVWNDTAWVAPLADIEDNSVTDAKIVSVSDTKVTTDDGAGGALFTTVRGFINRVLSSTGSAFVGFIQNFTGAVARSVQDRLRDTVNVKDFGAVGDGVVDDTAAMQAAHNTGRLVYYPAGTYLFTNNISIANGGIVGDGMTQTFLKSNDATTANLITYTGSYVANLNVPKFADFQLVGNEAKAQGAGLSVNSGTGETEYLNFTNVTFSLLPIGIAFERASLWKIIGCNFLACSVAGVRVRNLNVADAGDSVIMGCVFNNPFATGDGVLQQSSGGLKVVGNKFLGGRSAYYLLYDSSNGGTSVLNICDNSIEQMANAGLLFSNAAGASPFTNIIVANNEFGVQPRGISIDAGLSLTEVVITGNIFNLAASPGTPFGIGANDLNRFLISGNVFRGNGGASTGVSLVNCSNGKVGVNTYSNLSTVFAESGSANVHTTLTRQSGTGVTSTAGWASYGSGFRSPATTVNFPTAFLVAPSLADIRASVIATGGETTVIVTSATAGSFTCVVLADVSGIAAQFSWEASGVL